MAADEIETDPATRRGAELGPSEDSDAQVQLIPEDDVQGIDFSGSETERGTAESDGARANPLDELERTLAEQGFAVRREDGDLVLELPAGRSHRPIYFSERVAESLPDLDYRDWRSLERFDGIVNLKAGIAEVALRGERFSVALSRVLLGLGAEERSSVDDGQDRVLVLADEESGVKLRLASASPVGAALLGPRRRYPGIHPPLTLTLTDVRMTSTAEADDLIEIVTDALSVQIGIRTGLQIAPRRLESQQLARTHHRRPRGNLLFPRSRYPHAPVALYLSGRERHAAPLQRFWAFYQVLEYFFPKYARAERLRVISQLVRSPTFDPYDEEQVLRLTAMTDAAGERLSEVEQLNLCLSSITTSSELRAFIQESGLAERLGAKKSRLSKHLVAADSEELIAQMARRIYEIRCKIVHSKAASEHDFGGGLLPGTNDEELVRIELPVVDFLAEKALIASSERLDFRAFRLS